MQVGKYIVEYLEDTHIYLVNGVVTPSITQLLKKHFPVAESIPQNILENARKRGNRVHKEIEDYEHLESIKEPSTELKNYVELKDKYKFNVVDVEKIVVLEKDGQVVACGRLDQLIEIDGELAINDIKSTYKLNYEYLYHQTNLYRIAHNQTYGTKIKKCYATHLKGATAKFQSIPCNDAIVAKIIDEYLETHKEEIEIEL